LLLIWAVRRIGRLRWLAGDERRRQTARGGAKRRRRLAGGEAKVASRTPIRTGKLPEGRGECEDLYHGLEGVGAAPEEEIGATALRRRSCSGVAALR
jgi:hypothetical protein